MSDYIYQADSCEEPEDLYDLCKSLEEEVDDQQERIAELKKENKRLDKRVESIAYAMCERDIRIAELETQLKAVAIDRAEKPALNP